MSRVDTSSTSSLQDSRGYSALRAHDDESASAESDRNTSAGAGSAGGLRSVMGFLTRGFGQKRSGDTDPNVERSGLSSGAISSGHQPEEGGPGQSSVAPFSAIAISLNSPTNSSPQNDRKFVLGIFSFV